MNQYFWLVLDLQYDFNHQYKWTRDKKSILEWSFNSFKPLLLLEWEE